MSLQQVELTVRRPGHPERRIPLTQGVNHLGRADTNDVVLSDIGVSRRHARIVIGDDTVFIEDLGSGNGTFFRGERIQQQPVRNGDEVLVDPFVLSFAIQQEESTNAEGLTGELEDVGDEDTVEVPSDPTLPPSPRNLEPKRRARLTTLIGQRLAPSYGVRTEGLTIGRSEARDVILFDPAASRNHAILEFVGDDVWLRDHGSGNGTFVNGSRVREQCLRHGDRLRVGGTEFRFELIGAEASEPPTLPPRPQELRVARTDLEAQPRTAPAKDGPAKDGPAKDGPASTQGAHTSRPSSGRNGSDGWVRCGALDDSWWSPCDVRHGARRQHLGCQSRYPGSPYGRCSCGSQGPALQAPSARAAALRLGQLLEGCKPVLRCPKIGSR